MELDILITIVITSLIQSIFGVGVLLFGTPILLALGYDFTTSIMILLPISLAINLLQIFKDYKKIDMVFYKKVFFYTIPFVVIFLFIITRLNFNIGIIVGFFILLVAIKDFSPHIKEMIKSLTRHEKLYLITMGIIHGATNLGGSLLTAIIHSKEYNKETTRATVAASYATFAAFQIATLLISVDRLDINILQIGLYLAAGIAVFTITELLLYVEISNTRYTKFFGFFLLCTGILLCIQSI